MKDLVRYFAEVSNFAVYIFLVFQRETPLWSVGVTSSRFVWIFTFVFALAFVLECRIHYIAVSLIFITLIVAYFSHLYARFICSFVHTLTLHRLLAHHRLCYVNDGKPCFHFVINIKIWTKT